MSPYDGMKLVAALRLLFRTGRRRPRSRPSEEAVTAASTAKVTPSAADLLDWHPHIRREPDPRQPSLPLEPNAR